MNPETECIEEPFMGWGAGIHREEIWHWFDQRHSKGVVYLLYHTESSETKTLMLWKNDFTHERNWNAVCEALGIKKEDTEVELRCVVCSHKERPETVRSADALNARATAAPIITKGSAGLLWYTRESPELPMKMGVSTMTSAKERADRADIKEAGATIW